MITYIPIKSRLVECGDDLVKVLADSLDAQDMEIQDGDIIAIASKVISASQNSFVVIDDIVVTDKAMVLSTQTGLDTRYVQAVLDDCVGDIYGIGRGFILCESRYGVCSNAGVDNSNVPPDKLFLLPSNLELELERIADHFGKHIGLIVTDSRSIPGRYGVTGIALAAMGLKGFVDERGRKDIYDRTMRITTRAVADQLSSGSVLLMGECDELIPFVVIRSSQLCDGTGFQAFHDLMLNEKDIYIGSIIAARRRKITRED